MQGNDKYKCKENASALRLYTESIICAPEFGPELSVGFGNRFYYYCTDFCYCVTLSLLPLLREYHLCSEVWIRAQPGLWQLILSLWHGFLPLCELLALLPLQWEYHLHAPEFEPELSLGFGNRFFNYCTGFYYCVTLALLPLHRKYHLCSRVWTRA